MYVSHSREVSLPIRNDIRVGRRRLCAERGEKEKDACIGEEMRGSR